MERRKFLKATAAASALSVLGTGPGAAEEEKALYAAAKQEGQVTWYAARFHAPASSPASSAAPISSKARSPAARSAFRDWPSRPAAFPRLPSLAAAWSSPCGRRASGSAAPPEVFEVE